MSFLFSGRVQLSKCAKNFTLPHLWLDTTYVRCRRDGRVASTAVVTAIGCDEGGWRRVLGLSVMDTESYDSWLGFLRRIKGRSVQGVQLVTSDAHKGLVGAIEEVFQGASWQRCAVNLMRDCKREAGSRQLKKRVGREIKRRSRVMQVFPSERSLERLVGAVMCEQDEQWSASRYFAYDKMQELYDERRKKEPEEPGRPAADLAEAARKIIS